MYYCCLRLSREVDEVDLAVIAHSRFRVVLGRFEATVWRDSGSGKGVVVFVLRLVPSDGGGDID